MDSQSMPVDIKEISRRIKQSGIKDEWVVYCRMAGGNHTAAFMLRRCVVWSNGKRVQNAGGWFYKTAQDWKDEACIGRSALERATDALSGLLKTEIRQVKVNSRYAVGKTCTHYRLDPAALYTRLDEVLHEITEGPKEGLSPADVEPVPPVEESPGMHDLSKTDCTNPAIGDAESVQPAMHESRSTDCTEPASDDVETVQLNLSLERNSELQPGRENQNLILSKSESEIRYFHSLKSEFLGFEQCEHRLIQEYRRIGQRAFDMVLDRCRGRGGHWNYVLTAVAGAHPPTPLPPPPIGGEERDQDGIGARHSITGDYYALFER